MFDKKYIDHYYRYCYKEKVTFLDSVYDVTLYDVTLDGNYSFKDLVFPERPLWLTALAPWIDVL